MRPELFATIQHDLVSDVESNYFTQRQDALKCPGFLPEQMITCALRMLAYGSSANQLDEVIRMAESTVLKTLEKFCTAIIRIYGSRYLRSPTATDLELLLK